MRRKLAGNSRHLARPLNLVRIGVNTEGVDMTDTEKLKVALDALIEISKYTDGTSPAAGAGSTQITGEHRKSEEAQIADDALKALAV